MSIRQTAMMPIARYCARPLSPPTPGPQAAMPIERSPSERLLRLPELIRTIGVSRATVYRYIDSGRLPPPVKLSTRCVAWRASEITAWMAALQG